MIQVNKLRYQKATSMLSMKDDMALGCCSKWQRIGLSEMLALDNSAPWQARLPGPASSASMKSSTLRTVGPVGGALK